MNRWLAALRPDRGGPNAVGPLSGRGWAATVIALHLFTALVLVLAFLTAVLGGGHLPAATAVAVLAAGYVLVGARAVRVCADGHAITYLLLLVVALGVVSYDDPSMLYLLTLAYPQVWFLTEAPRPGLLWTGLLGITSTVALVAGIVARGGSPLSAIADSAVGLVFSVVMGLWIGWVLAQSRQRVVLIDELERARAALGRAHHEQGVMTERERLAREVHDTIAQGYTSIVVLAQTAQAELAVGSARVPERLDLIAEVARDNLRETRAIVAAFSPVALDGSTLIEALNRLGARFARETGLAVDVEAADVTRASWTLSRDQEVVLLRTAQEGLSNSRRHADARRVWVTLTHEGPEVVLRVHDDGAGFEPTVAAGYGLIGLEGRIQQAGGALDVSSAPGRGTVLAARLPAAP